MANFKRLFLILILGIIAGMFGEIQQAMPQEHYSPYIIPVLVVKYFPVKGENIDISVTGDWGEALEETRAKTDRLTKEIIAALQEGSRYRGYKHSSSKPSLEYSVVHTIEFLKPLPTYNRPGDLVPMTDYSQVMSDINIRHWVEEAGIKEVWIWGYHGGVIGIWESNMSSSYGDVSNSDRSTDDLPILSKTYTVYHYNYQRGVSEAAEDHVHQIEAVLRNIDSDLFWNKFVGKEGEARCGWAHYPPNAQSDYDWSNKKYVWTDCEDWNPQGGGQKEYINCEKWNCDSLQWFIYWMQNIPGENNGLAYGNSVLRNWWIFIGDYDYAMKNKLRLVK